MKIVERQELANKSKENNNFEEYKKAIGFDELNAMEKENITASFDARNITDPNEWLMFRIDRLLEIHKKHK